MPLSPMPERSWLRTARTSNNASLGDARPRSAASSSALRPLAPLPEVMPISRRHACTSCTRSRTAGAAAAATAATASFGPPPSVAGNAAESRATTRAASAPRSPLLRSSAFSSSMGRSHACASACTTRLSPTPSLSGRVEGVSCIVAMARQGSSSSGASRSANESRSVMSATPLSRAGWASMASIVDASRAKGMPSRSSSALRGEALHMRSAPRIRRRPPACGARSSSPRRDNSSGHLSARLDTGKRASAIKNCLCMRHSRRGL